MSLTSTTKQAYKPVRDFLASEDGPTAVEYAVMLGMILLAVLTAITVVGQQTATNYTNSSNSLTEAMNPSN